jgi:hypothetical protein
MRTKRFVARDFRRESCTTRPLQRYLYPPFRRIFADRIARRAYVESEDPVRTAARLCLVVLLVTSLLDIPAFAATAKPLGMVIQAQEAQLDNAKLAVGTTVYPGETVVTDAGCG